MEDLQCDVASAASFEGAINPSDDITVAGVDQGFVDDHAVSVVIVMEDGDVIEETAAARQVKTPYIPGLLSFREGEAIIAALRKLDANPDVILFDGSGRIHYRQAGIATHIGVVFDKASVGVAKNLLCGDTTKQDSLPLGETKPVTADDSVVNAENGTVIGSVFQSRQYDASHQSINPLYVSPGHRVGVDQATSLVNAFCTTWKLPEPIHRADRQVSKRKEHVVQ
jgi:deoxyribonuclease V